MANLTPSKEALLDHLNQEATSAHQKEKEKAERGGRVAPAAPVALAPDNIEYPKWLYHSAKKDPALVTDAAAHEALGAGWVESPAEAAAAKEPKVTIKPAPIQTPEPEPEYHHRKGK